MITRLRPGDWLLSALLLSLTIWLGLTLWRGADAGNVRIHARGKLFAEAPLRHNRLITVPGPLGPTQIEIRDGRVRVARDPSPRQYCVQQGWLTRAGQIAICLPNQVSIELVAPDQPYDTISF